MSKGTPITTMKQFAFIKMSNVIASPYASQEKKRMAFDWFSRIFDEYVTEDKAAVIFAELADTDRELQMALKTIDYYKGKENA